MHPPPRCGRVVAIRRYIEVRRSFVPDALCAARIMSRMMSAPRQHPQSPAGRQWPAFRCCSSAGLDEAGCAPILAVNRAAGVPQRVVSPPRAGSRPVLPAQKPARARHRPSRHCQLAGGGKRSVSILRLSSGTRCSQATDGPRDNARERIHAQPEARYLLDGFDRVAHCTDSAPSISRVD